MRVETQPSPELPVREVEPFSSDHRLSPFEVSIVVATISSVAMLAASLYHYQILYWVSIVRADPSSSAALSEQWTNLAWGIASLILIGAGILISSRFGRVPFVYWLTVLMVEFGILYISDTLSFVINLPAITSDLSSNPLCGGSSLLFCLLDYLFFSPRLSASPILVGMLSSFVFAIGAIRRSSTNSEISFSTFVVMFFPISAGLLGDYLQDYTGTGGGAAFTGLVFLLGWVFIYVGGTRKTVASIPLLAVGALLNFFPTGIGLLMGSLAYLVRARSYSSRFYAALAVSLVSVAAGLYFILTGPLLK